MEKTKQKKKKHQKKQCDKTASHLKINFLGSRHENTLVSDKTSAAFTSRIPPDVVQSYTYIL